MSSLNSRCFLACDGEGEAMSALDGGIGVGVTGSFEEEDAEVCSMKGTFESWSSDVICCCGDATSVMSSKTFATMISQRFIIERKVPNRSWKILGFCNLSIIGVGMESMNPLS